MTTPIPADNFDLLIERCAAVGLRYENRHPAAEEHAVIDVDSGKEWTRGNPGGIWGLMNTLLARKEAGESILELTTGRIPPQRTVLPNPNGANPMPKPNIINFDKKMQVISWVDDNVIATVEFADGLRLMTNSTRFDSNHASNSVRKLHKDDALRLKHQPRVPVTFRQCS